MVLFCVFRKLIFFRISDDPLSHKTIMMRKEAITEWLKKSATSVISEEVEKCNVSKQNNKHVAAVMSLLSGREMEDACSRLQKAGTCQLFLKEFCYDF